MADYIKHTADDEEPNCNQCVFCCDDPKYCEECCGPEHGWARYERYEEVNDG